MPLSHPGLVWVSEPVPVKAPLVRHEQEDVRLHVNKHRRRVSSISRSPSTTAMIFPETTTSPTDARISTSPSTFARTLIRPSLPVSIVFLPPTKMPYRDSIFQVLGTAAPPTCISANGSGDGSVMPTPLHSQQSCNRPLESLATDNRPTAQH